MRDGTLFSIDPSGADERALARVDDPLLPGETLRGSTAVLHTPPRSARLLDVTTGVERTLSDGFEPLTGTMEKRASYLGGSFGWRYGRGPSLARLVLSDDGRQAAGVRRREGGFEVVLMDAETGASSVLLPLDERPWLLDFLPGGGRLLVVTGDPGEPRAGQDLLVDVATAHVTRLPGGHPVASTYAAAASPDGRLLALRDGAGLRLIDVDARSLLWVRPMKVQYVSLAFSRDGSRIFATERAPCRTRVLMFTADATGTLSELDCQKDIGLLAYVLDDATVAILNGRLVYDVWIDAVTFTSGEKRRLLSKAVDGALKASLDGQTRLVHGNMLGGGKRVWLERSEGTLGRVLAQVDPASTAAWRDQAGWGDGDFSPDGRWVVFGCDEPGRPLLCISPVSEADGEPRVLTTGWAPIWLP